MFNRTASTKFIAPRRQGAKKNIFLPQLGVLCVFARVFVFAFRKATFKSNNFSYL
jgi:hypothetical protein